MSMSIPLLSAAEDRVGLRLTSEGCFLLDGLLFDWSTCGPPLGPVSSRHRRLPGPPFGQSVKLLGYHDLHFFCHANQVSRLGEISPRRDTNPRDLNGCKILRNASVGRICRNPS